MRIAVLDETKAGEPRVAVTPDTIGKLKALGAEIAIEKGAGAGADIPDSAFEAAGASIGTAAATLKGAHILLSVRRPSADAAGKLAKGALVIGMLDPYSDAEGMKALAEKGVTARITTVVDGPFA
ncbi:MAG: NAD(P)(+) transhydrogenase (Re/Si-specific) subunit alpha, partial [Rhabdaerophilum sp.]